MELSNGYWALVELMGHKKLAGFISEYVIGGQSLLRIDVPEVGTIPAWTKMVGVSSIYAINPMDEDSARVYAGQIRETPIESWNLQNFLSERISELVANGALTRSQELRSGDEEDQDW